jgi:hypothetical protein
MTDNSVCKHCGRSIDKSIEGERICNSCWASSQMSIEEKYHAGEIQSLEYEMQSDSVVARKIAAGLKSSGIIADSVQVNQMEVMVVRMGGNPYFFNLSEGNDQSIAIADVVRTICSYFANGGQKDCD